MSACIGWEGPCPIHGQFHGCELDTPHAGSIHRCECGATSRRTIERHNPPVAFPLMVCHK